MTVRRLFSARGAAVVDAAAAAAVGKRGACLRTTRPPVMCLDPSDTSIGCFCL